MLVEVTFKGSRRDFFEWPYPGAPALKTPVIVQAEHGEDMGTVHSTGELAMKRRAGTTHGKASRDPLRKVVRAASADEIARAAQLRADEHEVRARAIEKARALGLDLKVSDTEWQWDKKRLAVYFTAEHRVDFRQFVRQLEGLFGARVHMWHIGVRDEAKRLNGIGRCGRQFCSAAWLPDLTPVKSSVAKDQHLSTLNPSQISGACGRLMCCLRYEHEFYVEQRRRFPKEGKLVRTSAGEEKVASVDIFRETVTLRPLSGEPRVVPLEQLRRELAGELPAWALRDGGDRAAASDDEADDAADTGAARDPREPDMDAPGTDAPGTDAYAPDRGDVAEHETEPGTRDEQRETRATQPATRQGGQRDQADGGHRRRRGHRGGRRGRGPRKDHNHKGGNTT